MNDNAKTAKTNDTPTYSRRDFGKHSLQAAGLAALQACGGGGGALADTSIAAAPTSAPLTPSTGTAWTTLFITATGIGRQPYSATVLPLRGQVPAASRILSPDDTTLDYSVLSTWDDGSVAVAIVAGTVDVGASLNSTLRIDVISNRLTSPPAALTTADISSVVKSMAIRFNNGSSVVTNLLQPERIWWRNAQLICARYRGNSLEGGMLQVVFDVHVFADGSALVEAVVENSGINTANPASVRTAQYQSATLEVNGSTVSEPIQVARAPEAAHAPFRAWYTSARLGKAGTVRATQDHLDLQKHPLFFKYVLPSSFNMAAYAGDRYSPWSTGRQRGVGMGAAGDAPSIGYITQWDARFIQSGDHRAAMASEASALACLTFNINYRDIGSGRIPDFTSIGARDHQTANKFWPSYRNSDEKASWEVAHHPAAGLVAFVVRPTPVYIEIAQKICVWNGTWSGFGNDTPWSAGLHGRFYQTRGKAWCLRSLAHAAFITPEGDPWRAPALDAIDRNIGYLSRWMTDPKQKLHVIWDNMPTYDLLDADGWPGFQGNLWMQHYMVPVIHATAGARLLSGTRQQNIERFADWIATQAVRWVNEQPDGAWRYTAYHVTIGTDPKTISSLDNWGDMVRWARGDRPPSVKGPWMDPEHAVTKFADAKSRAAAVGGAYWEDIFWSALAVAVERNLPGSKTAWDTVQANLTHLSTWLTGFANDPRFGLKPRNL